MSQIEKAKKDFLTNGNQKKIITTVTKLGANIDKIFRDQYSKLDKEYDTALKKEASNKKKKVEELSEEEKEDLFKPFSKKIEQLESEKRELTALLDDD